MKTRCAWAGNDLLYTDYHDNEWGDPVHDERRLFEFLVLEGAQAGLSWITILRKRENYRLAFDGFDPAVVAGYGQAEIDELLDNPDIVRNRLKIQAAITNAQAFLETQQAFGSFDRYIWQFTNGTSIQNNWGTHKDVPVNTVQSDLMSRDLKSRGFKFVGSTICYAFMQAVGMINDHTVDCFRHRELTNKT
jgi:DNA-3-methyladenine glycosylase I